MVGRKLNADIV